MCVWIPENVSIYSVKLIEPKIAALFLPPDEKEIDYKSSVRYGLRMILTASFPYTRLQPNLNAFIVSKEDCNLISKGISVKQCYFETGYHIRIAEEPEEIYPWKLSRGSIQVQENNSPFMERDETIVQKDRYFAIFPKLVRNEDPRRYDTQEITLTLDNLLISATALDDFIEKQNDTLPASIFTPHARTSKALIKLAKAVQRFWSQTSPETTEYPDSREIRNYLTNKDIIQYPDYLAKAAVRLICPYYAKRGNYKPLREEDQSNDSLPGYISTNFKAMIDLSNQYWNVDQSKSATNEVVTAAFEERKGFKSDAIYAAMLIRPENALKGENRTKPKIEHLQ